ncbi:peptidoglycan recognition protein 6 isoform X2 [Eucyclogobius newberryi]|uniref:peptidoglycan recognition protein 6 isoform X2 n=1 Tax=Eucyclogobius newberryi TaxID=166745 RepID=UPI003B5BD2F1
MEHHWRCVLVLVGVLFVLGTDASSWHMTDFIEALKELEDGHPDLKPVHLLKALRGASGLTDPFIQHYLGRPPPASSPHFNVSTDLIPALHYHIAANNQERGVVLTGDGTTVALRPLLLGIEAGFLRRLRWDVPSRHPSTLLTKKSPQNEDLGPDGCWDDPASPQTFTLAHRPSLLTAAQINGGMDGVILAREAVKSPLLKLSALLTLYYGHQLDHRGLDAAPRIISRRRRENFKPLMESSESSLGVLRMEAVAVVEMRRRMKGQRVVRLKEKKQMMAAFSNRVKELVQKYTDCPPIVPRCMWGAKPYKGTPTNLTLPLRFLYIHHTATPSQPCLTFQQCSADMRSMQRFHQDDRGWDDIGYSFVAGSDGYIYEGRGWHWQGAHTLGHNSIGYGVSFIGDYSRALPSADSMELVRDKLASCAVRGGRLVDQFVLQGHRQVVAGTACPGDTFYSEIQTWEHFGEVTH